MKRLLCAVLGHVPVTWELTAPVSRWVAHMKFCRRCLEVLD